MAGSPGRRWRRCSHAIEEAVSYGDGDDPEAAEARALPLGELIDGVPGELDLALACEALAVTAADDTWTDRPFVDGVVLIGDAAGSNDPPDRPGAGTGAA